VNNTIGCSDVAQHFLLPPAAETLALANVMRMSNEEAEVVFARICWPETDGPPVCPHCTGQSVYNVRRPNGPLRWRCKACNREFTVTSGTLFAWHKMPVQSYLSAGWRGRRYGTSTSRTGHGPKSIEPSGCDFAVVSQIQAQTCALSW
jgi:hypothetical protein